MTYTKVNRNSLGQFLRSRERLVWLSIAIRPAETTVDENGVAHTKPAALMKPGLTYRRNE